MLTGRVLSIRPNEGIKDTLAIFADVIKLFNDTVSLKSVSCNDLL